VLEKVAEGKRLAKTPEQKLQEGRLLLARSRAASASSKYESLVAKSSASKPHFSEQSPKGGLKAVPAERNAAACTPKATPTEKKPVAAARSADPKATHISLHLKCGLQEGKTMADLEALYAKEVEVVKKQPGCLHFQIDMTEDSLDGKVALLTEKYASAAAHLETNKALAAAGLVEGENGIFATYDFVDLKFGLPESELTEDYRGLLAQFEQVTGNKPTVITHDFGGWVNTTGDPGGAAKSDHIILTATCGLQPGKTLADMKALYEKEVEVAIKTPGCLHFQLEMNEDTVGAKTAVLHEMYADAAGHLELNKNLAAAGLVEGEDGIFATYRFEEMVFGMCDSAITEEYQGLLGQFEQVTGHKPIIHQYSGPGKIRKSTAAVAVETPWYKRLRSASALDKADVGLNKAEKDMTSNEEAAPKAEDGKPEAKAKKSWFGWGKKEQVIEEVVEEAVEEAEDGQVEVRDVPAAAAETQPKKSWFGRKKKEEVAEEVVEETEDGQVEVRDVPAAAVSEAKTKKSWFGRKKKEEVVEEVVEEAEDGQVEVKDVPAAAAAAAPEAQPKKKSGWFSRILGGKAAKEAEEAGAEEQADPTQKAVVMEEKVEVVEEKVKIEAEVDSVAKAEPKPKPQGNASGATWMSRVGPQAAVRAKTKS